MFILGKLLAKQFVEYFETPGESDPPKTPGGYVQNYTGRYNLKHIKEHLTLVVESMKLNQISLRKLFNKHFIF